MSRRVCSNGILKHSISKYSSDQMLSKEKNLQYLRAAQKNSIKKQSAVVGVHTPPPNNVQSIYEVLTNQFELDNAVQHNLAKILTLPDGRPKNVYESDDDYQMRFNPRGYILTRLSTEQKKIFVTDFIRISEDTNGIKLIPSDLISYMENYQRSKSYTGGVGGFLINSISSSKKTNNPNTLVTFSYQNNKKLVSTIKIKIISTLASIIFIPLRIIIIGIITIIVKGVIILLPIIINLIIKLIRYLKCKLFN
jgi:hypothetical protein